MRWQRASVDLPARLAIENVLDAWNQCDEAADWSEVQQALADRDPDLLDAWSHAEQDPCKTFLFLMEAPGDEVAAARDQCVMEPALGDHGALISVRSDEVATAFADLTALVRDKRWGSTSRWPNLLAVAIDQRHARLRRM
jgi:hypothetical protein